MGQSTPCPPMSESKALGSPGTLSRKGSWSPKTIVGGEFRYSLIYYLGENCGSGKAFRSTLPVGVNWNASMNTNILGII